MTARLKILYGWLLFFKGFYLFKKEFHTALEKADLVFFFPFYHTGGAEKVHLDICNAFNDKNVVVVFTDKSANNHYLGEFRQNRTVFLLPDVFHKTKSKDILESYIVKKLKDCSISIFGCHSLLFYKVCEKNTGSTTKVDLIHAFTNSNEKGFEKVSTKYIPYLDTRVTISKRTQTDLLDQYKDLSKLDYSDRIHVIYNAVPEGPSLYIEKPKEVNILFVGRASVEKRVQIVGEIATQLHSDSVNVHFIGGGIEELIDESDKVNCIFHGNVNSADELNQIYSSAHIILITSYREGIPVVVQEAMKHGVIPICTEVGGIKELLGVKLIDLIEDEDIQAQMFVKAIRELVADNDLFITLSRDIFEDAKSKYTVKEFQNKYREILNFREIE